MTIQFLTRGDIYSLTGGYLYNLRMIEGLELKGYSVNIVGSDWPWDQIPDLEKTSHYFFENLGYGSCIIVDSLVVGSMYKVIREFTDRLIFLGLIHLPASYNVLSGVHGKLADEELQGLHHTRMVIVTGQFTGDLLRNAGLIPAKIRIVEPGTEQFPRKRHYNAVPSQLLCIANFTKFKAQDILIRALHKLTGWEWTLHLYGDTDREREYGIAVRSLIQQLNLEHRVKIHGIVERDEISSVFLNSDLFVMPSLFESYGMTLTESLAHGIPVVSTFAGNIPNTVPDGMGLLTEPGNAEQLGDAIRSLLDDPVKYSGLCRAASRYHLRARSWEHAVDEFERIIRNLIAG